MSPTTRSRRRAGLGDEAAFALPMTLLLVVVLAIVGTSIVLYSTGNDKHASRSKQVVTNYALAQSGVDGAVSQLANAPQTPAGGAGAVTDRNFFTNLCATASNCQTTTNGGTVQWTGTLMNRRTGAAWTGSFAPVPDLYWHLTATATRPNPAGPGKLSRTVGADAIVTPTTTQPIQTPFSPWEYVYSRKTGDPDGCDEEIQNNPNIASSFYVAGNLCLYNNSNFIGPRAGDPEVNVYVQGSASMVSPQTSIGTNSRPVTSAQIRSRCSYKGGPFGTCDPAHKVWADTITTSPPTIDPPSFSFVDTYATAGPGPAHPCLPQLSTGSYPTFDTDGLRNNSQPVWDITPSGQPYDCKADNGGEIKWTPGSPGQLFVTGTIYYDGGAWLSSAGAVKYSGLGAIYLSGAFDMRQSQLCAALSGSNCNFNAWTFSNDFLVVVADGSGSPATSGSSVTIEQQSQFQGALYGTSSLSFENNTNVQGPMVSQEEIIQNSLGFSSIPKFGNVSFGLPGNPVTTYRILPPTNYTG